MYICICNALSENRLSAAVREGEVKSVDELYARLGVRPRCRKCVAHVERTWLRLAPGPGSASAA